MDESYCILCRRSRPKDGGKTLRGRFICARHLGEDQEEISREDFKLGLELTDLALKIGRAE